MDGVHDLGGMHGFGTVDQDDAGPPFAADWERRAFGLAGVVTVLQGRSFTAARAAMERMDPAHYLTSPYYEHWLTATATLAIEAGMVDEAALSKRAGGRFPLSNPAPDPEKALVVLPPYGQQRFGKDQKVRVKTASTPGHTRCPRYVRGRTGTVIRINAPTAFPDLEAATGEVIPEASYCVRFLPEELWGQDEGIVHVDLWDSYLEPA